MQIAFSLESVERMLAFTFLFVSERAFEHNFRYAF